MRITIIGGTKYVGLTTAVGLVTKGHMVFCVGRNKEKVEKIQAGSQVIYEEGLKRNVKGGSAGKKLMATTN